MKKITTLHRFFFATTLLILSIEASTSNSTTMERLSTSHYHDQNFFFSENDKQGEIQRITKIGYDAEANARDEALKSSFLRVAMDSLQSIQENQITLTKYENATQFENPCLRGNLSVNKTTHRELRDIEATLNEMSNKPPETWTAYEWVVFVIFLCVMGWVVSCLCALCCCGGNSNILGLFCLWEICCRDGQDIDLCCNYRLA